MRHDCNYYTVYYILHIEYIKIFKNYKSSYLKPVIISSISNHSLFPNHYFDEF